MGPWLGRAFILAGLILLVTPPSVSAWTNRDDAELDESWTIGRLQWSEKKGTISWTNESGPEDPGWQGANPSPGAVPPPDEFLSEPLPATYYLNASRNIHLDLAFVSDSRFTFCKGQTIDAPLQVAVYANGSLLAGAGRGGAIQPYPYRNEAGHAVCRYRMAPEMYVLPAGAQVKIQVTYTQAGDAYKFRLDGEQPSLLRFGSYTPEDLFWREPGLFQDPWDDPTQATPLAQLLQLISSATALGAVAVSAGRRGSRRVLVAAALVVMLSAGGCLDDALRQQGPDSNQLGGQESLVNETIQDPRGLNFSQAGKGSLLGRVNDEATVPLSGAYVSLLGTAHYTRTNAVGRFQFLNLDAGSYRVRIDKEIFQSVEFKTKIVADKVTRIQVTMLPVNGSATDERPHRHDYWNERTEIELFNGEVGTCTTGYQAYCSLPLSWTVPPKEGEADLVMPGTREIEVETTWDPARVGYSKLILLIRHNGDTWVGQGNPSNHSAYMPRGPGVSVSPQANWEMTDVGHQRFSTWTFGWLGDPASPVAKPPLSTDPEPPLSVRIVIRKGVVPLEPPHPDHWKGAHELVVDSGKVRTMLPGRLHFTDSCVYQSKDDNGDGGAYYNGYPGPPIEWNYGSYSAVYPMTGLVADGATHLVVEVKTQRAPRDAVMGGYGLETWYKAGDTPAAQAFALPPYGIDRGMRTPNPMFQLAPPPTLSGDGTLATWTIPLAAADADGIYNKRSSWQLVTMPDNLDAACSDAVLNSAAASTGGGLLELSLEVKAVRGVA